MAFLLVDNGNDDDDNVFIYSSNWKGVFNSSIAVIDDEDDDDDENDETNVDVDVVDVVDDELDVDVDDDKDNCDRDDFEDNHKADGDNNIDVVANDDNLFNFIFEEEQLKRNNITQLNSTHATCIILSK